MKGNPHVCESNTVADRGSWREEGRALMRMQAKPILPGSSPGGLLFCSGTGKVRLYFDLRLVVHQLSFVSFFFFFFCLSYFFNGQGGWAPFSLGQTIFRIKRRGRDGENPIEAALSRNLTAIVLTPKAGL